MMPPENISGLEKELDNDIQKLYLKVVRDSYREYIHRSDSSYMRVLSMFALKAEQVKELCKIELNPDFPGMKDAVQKGYSDAFDMYSIDFVYALKRFCNTNPDKKLVQEFYLSQFKYADVDEAKKFKELIGIEPDYEFPGMKDAIQEGYIYASSKKIRIDDGYGYRNFELAEKLYNFTGIPPDLDMLAKYPKYTKNLRDVQ